jgi:Rod binding domain-containing protein
MAADINISAAADLAANSWTVSRSSNQAAIPENETFHSVFRTAADQASAKKDSPEKISGVAKQFEALMVGQILKSARESSGGGWLSDEDSQDDPTGSMVMELAEQGFSQAIAARGGLGIAKMVTANIERGQAKTPSSDSEAPAPEAAKNTKLMNTATHLDSKRSTPPSESPKQALHSAIPHP